MISVVIPTYNRSQSLKRCLLSLKEQTFRDYEVLVVDDGSTDDTGKVFDSVKANNFRYIKKENGGQSSARNWGVKEAKGEIIAFTDDDCMVSPEWLKSVNDDFKGSVKCVKGRTEVLNLSKFTRDLRKYIYVSSSSATNNIAYDRKTILDLGLFDESMRLHEDLDFFWRFKLAGHKGSYSDDMVVFHEYEKNIEEFNKVSFNRGMGLRRFFRKFLSRKPSVAIAYVVADAIPLVYPPITRSLYLKRLRAVHLFKGFFKSADIFKIH